MGNLIQKYIDNNYNYLLLKETHLLTCKEKYWINDSTFKNELSYHKSDSEFKKERMKLE